MAVSAGARWAWRGALAAVLALAAVSCGGAGPGPTPSSGVTPTATPEPTATATPGPSPTPQPAPSPTPPSGVTYIVQPGDTLTAIARLFGTTVAAIVEANGLADPDALLVGQVLLIPVTGPLPSPTPAGSAQVVRLGNASRRQVAITFDAAADAGFAAQILDTLKAEEVRASFGITGRWAESNPELLRRMVREGHHLVNHSYDHPSFVEISREERWEQLDRTEEIVQGLARATTKPFFRPPFGAYDASVNADVYARGYLYTLMWTVDSLGWQGLAAEEISRRVLELAQPGAIIVFHVGAASQDANALPTIISGLRDMGYEMGAVPEVLAP